MSDAAFAHLLRPHIAAMEAYVPILPFEVLSRELGRSPDEIIKLDANENAYGTPDSVRRAIAEYPYVHIYPDPEQHRLREALEVYTGAPAANILPGQGADELIDLLCRVFLEPGDAVIDCPPTFGMYSFDAQLANAQILRVPRGADFRVDVAAIEGCVNGAADRLKLLFLTSPNNPDGSLLARADLERLLELPLVVVLDEAYVEFAGLDVSVARWVAQRENLIVLRTFSKWAGLAGLRLGYGVFPTWLMPTLWKFKQPYNVNVAATAGGLAALAHRSEIQPTIDALIRERDRLVVELGNVGYLQPYPSRSNFVLCQVQGHDAKDLKAQLAQRGILVRYFAKPGLESCIRVSSGKPEHTDALLEALRSLA